MAKNDAGNKHTEVTAASLIRRAKDHREYAKNYRLARPETPAGKVERLTLAKMHMDVARILTDEAKGLRAQR